MTYDDFEQSLKSLQNNQGLVLLTDDGNLLAYQVDENTLYDLTKTPDTINAVTYFGRPGWCYFQRYLELTYFHPDDGNINDELIMWYFKFHDILFSGLTIPTSHWEDLLASAEATDMHIIAQKIPCVMDSEGTHPFPSHQDTTYTVECNRGALAYQDQNLAYAWEEAQIANLEERIAKERKQR